MTPFVVGRDPWSREAMRADLWRHGLWQFRPMTGNFAWAGIDAALWDVCGKICGQPLYRLFGGLRRSEVSYFFYLAQGSSDEVARQCEEGIALGFEVFYLKVGIDIDAELEMVAAARAALGPTPLLRLDANGAWTVPEAIAAIRELATFDIQLVEQPCRTLEELAEVRRAVSVPVAADESVRDLDDARRLAELDAADAPPLAGPP
jgi:glucarate dehydratase